MVVDVGQVILLFSEFSRTGGNYIPFPDPRIHQIKLQDLCDEKIRQRLRQIWTDPMALDPSRANAQVTREVAKQLATVAKSLEADGHSAHQVGAFLTRCLFSIFAEDVGLLPASDKGEGKGAFSELLQTHRAHTPTLQRMLQALWTEMDRGGFNVAVQKEVLKFNGKLFKALQADGYALPLNRDQIDSLLEAAKANWTEVGPAIFGTLLERALDPACGSGNFLYVTLEHLKRLEGEVLNQIEALDAGQNSLNLEGETVTLQQLLGIRLNPRAAALAELVLWIGYLQWQATHRGRGHRPGSGSTHPPIPQWPRPDRQPTRCDGDRPVWAGCRRGATKVSGCLPMAGGKGEA